jgi:hypothetical protein
MEGCRLHLSWRSEKKYLDFFDKEKFEYFSALNFSGISHEMPGPGF